MDIYTMLSLFKTMRLPRKLKKDIKKRFIHESHNIITISGKTTYKEQMYVQQILMKKYPKISPINPLSIFGDKLGQWVFSN